MSLLQTHAGRIGIRCHDENMDRIFVVRHDKIGDFVLTWPAFYLLKTAFPDSVVDVLVALELETFARACPYIDKVIPDTGDDAALTDILMANRYNAALALHSQWRICKMVQKAKIPYTLAPEHKWYQYLYSDRASARYEKGEPCWRGNCMLVEHFIRRQGKEVPRMPDRLWNISSEARHWKDFYNQEGDEKLLFVHAGTGGSSQSLNVDQFARLLTRIRDSSSIVFKVILTFADDEKAEASELQELLIANDINVELATPLADLADFARSLVAADMFIAGSTGPLHLAGLHDVPTVGFYAGRRSRPDIRWQTLTQASKRLSFTPPVGSRTGRNMSLVDIEQAAGKIARFLDIHYLRSRQEAGNNSIIRTGGH